MLSARESFAIGDKVIARGEKIADDDAVVKGREHLFESINCPTCSDSEAAALIAELRAKVDEVTAERDAAVAERDAAVAAAKANTSKPAAAKAGS